MPAPALPSQKELATSFKPISPVVTTNNLAGRTPETNNSGAHINKHDHVTQRNAQELRELRSALATQRAALALAAANTHAASDAFSTPTRSVAKLNARRSKSKTPSTRGSPSLNSLSLRPSPNPMTQSMEKSSGNHYHLDSYPPRWWKLSGLIALALLISSAVLMTRTSASKSHAFDGDANMLVSTSIHGVSFMSSPVDTADEIQANRESSALVVASQPIKPSRLQLTARGVRRGVGGAVRALARAVFLPMAPILVGFLLFGFI